MTSEIDNDLKAKIQSLEGKSKDDLLAIIGAYSLSEDTDRLFLVQSRGVNLKTFKSHGEAFYKKIEPVLKEAICGNDGLMKMADGITVAVLVPTVLKVMGFAAGAVVPTVVVAISYLIIRAGIRKYCEGYPKPETAKA